MEAGKIARPSRAELEEQYRASFDPVEVGASLREARIAMRRDVSEVARDLRIRQVYIEAIENGDFDNLPGIAYQTGFLRAYGNYLGLDGAELADRLKIARNTIGSRDDLQVFSPVDEGHLPTRSILLLAALLAIAVYGVWYFIANSEMDPVERVAALPDRLANLIEGERDSGTEVAAPPSPAVDVAPPKPQPSARAGENAAGEGGRDATVTAIAERAAPTPEARAGTPQPAAPPDAGSVSEAQPPAPDVSPAGEPVPSAEAVATVLPAPPPESADRDSGAAETPGGGAAAAAGTVPRLVLRAVTDSWIEIAAGDEPPVYSGLLREGESYAVPERQGLKMVTGNAGGLEVLVDDRAIPRLGPPGAVLRDIDLDGLRRRENG